MLMLMCEEEFDSGSKRQRGIGLGASEGPVSLDDFRSLQRSNTVHFILSTDCMCFDAIRFHVCTL